MAYVSRPATLVPMHRNTLHRITLHRAIGRSPLPWLLCLVLVACSPAHSPSESTETPVVTTDQALPPTTPSEALAIEERHFGALAARWHEHSDEATLMLQQALVRQLDHDLERGLEHQNARARYGGLLVRLYDIALARGDSRGLEQANRLLSRGLADLREDGTHAAITERIRRFAEHGNRALWDQVDVRTVVPVLEALVDVGDAAALLRLTEAYMHGPLGRQLEGYRQHAISLAANPATLSRVPDSSACRLFAEDRDLGTAPGEHSLPPGSWHARCLDGDRVVREERLVLTPGASTLWSD